MRSIKVIAMVRAGDQNRGLLLSEGWRRDGTVRLALVMWHRVGAAGTQSLGNSVEGTRLSTRSWPGLELCEWACDSSGDPAAMRPVLSHWCAWLCWHVEQGQ